jgi:ribonuclease E
VRKAKPKASEAAAAELEAPAPAAAPAPAPVSEAPVNGSEAVSAEGSEDDDSGEPRRGWWQRTFGN